MVLSEVGPSRRTRCWLSFAPWLLAACSPTLDWRENIAPDTGIVTSFPCRPDRHSRAVEVAGQRVKIDMLVCPAGGATYAVSFFDVGQPADISAALLALRSALVTNLQGTIGPGQHPPRPVVLSLKGMTPNSEAGCWRVDGHRPDGSAVTAQSAFFARGLRVYQAAVVGSALPADAVEPFFEGLKFPG